MFTTATHDDALELRPGVTVFKQGGAWVSRVEDGRVVKIADCLPAALLVLEKEPTSKLLSFLAGFPTSALLRIALVSKSPRWIDRAVVWTDALGSPAELQPFLADAAAALPPSSQRTRQSLHALLMRMKGRKQA